MKQKATRSTKLRELARGQTCTLRGPACNGDPATVVLCHIRLPGFAGVGMKPPDWLAFHGCSGCHIEQEARRADPMDVLRAWAETMQRAVAAGLVTFK